MVLKNLPFSGETRRIIRERQECKCAICKSRSDILIYVAKDGNIFNNHISNCMALCPNCKKTSWILVQEVIDELRSKRSSR